MKEKDKQKYNTLVDLFAILARLELLDDQDMMDWFYRHKDPKYIGPRAVILKRMIYVRDNEWRRSINRETEAGTKSIMNSLEADLFGPGFYDDHD